MWKGEALDARWRLLTSARADASFPNTGAPQGVSFTPEMAIWARPQP
jgi:hypothetical protein